MTDSTVQAHSESPGCHLVLYDGVCGLCSRVPQFVLARDQRSVFNFAALQSVTGRAIVERFGGNPGELTTFCVCVNYRTPDGRILTKSRAALFVTGALGWPWTLARVAGVLPTWLVDRVHHVLAPNRYRVFCPPPRLPVPGPESHNRLRAY